MAASIKDEYLPYLRKLPALLSDVSVRYACLLAASISDKTVTPEMVGIITSASSKTEEPGWTEASYHGTWEQEQQLFHCIQEGNIDALPKAASGRIGRIGGGKSASPSQERDDYLFCPL